MTLRPPAQEGNVWHRSASEMVGIRGSRFLWMVDALGCRRCVVGPAVAAVAPVRPRSGLTLLLVWTRSDLLLSLCTPRSRCRVSEAQVTRGEGLAPRLARGTAAAGPHARRWVVNERVQFHWPEVCPRHLGTSSNDAGAFSAERAPGAPNSKRRWTLPNS
jgi:hypothetical protein